MVQTTCFLEFPRLYKLLRVFGYIMLLFCQQLFDLSLIIHYWKFGDYSWEITQSSCCSVPLGLFEIQILPQLNFLKWNNLPYDWLCEYFTELEYSLLGKRRGSGRKARMNSAVRRKEAQHSRRGRRLLLQCMWIIFLIFSSSVDCKMLLRRVAAISLACWTVKA